MTGIADVIVPEVFNPYVVEKTTEKAEYYLSGIVGNNPELDKLATTGGTKIEMPFWDDLGGDDENLSDTNPLTPDKITSGLDEAVLLTRGKAWKANDLAAALSGDDPMGTIANLVAHYWMRRFQAVIIANTKGIIAGNIANNSGDMVIDRFIEDGNSATVSNIIGQDAIIDAVATMGDHFGGLTGISMHSVPYFNLVKLNQIEFKEDADGQLTIPYYMGKRVIVDDGMPVRAGTLSGNVYTSALYGQGAFGLGNGAAPMPTETTREALAGNDVLITRHHFLLHPRGLRSTAAARPLNTELELAASHDRVYDRKHVRMAFLRTNG